MRREGFQIAVHGLQTVEWLFTAERRAGGFNRFSTVHTHESVQVLQWLAILFLALSRHPTTRVVVDVFAISAASSILQLALDRG